MPSPVQESFADLSFPLKGVDVSKGFGAQQPGTTPVGRNVRGYEPASKRAKGGGRPGLAKYLAAQLPSGAHLIQNLNIVDPADDSALLSNVFDWPGLPFGGVGDPSVPSVPLPPPAPVSIPAFPAFPGSPGFPAVPAFPGIAWTLDATTPGLGTGHTATVQLQNPQPGQPSSVTVAVPSDWGSTTVGGGIQSRNPGRIIPVGGSGAAPTKNKAKKLLPTIVWANPAPRPVGTVLTGTQLNAVARDPNTSAVVPGTYTYAPPAGTKTTTSPQSLYVLFTPTDLTKYTVNTKAVSISAPGYRFVQTSDLFPAAGLVGSTVTWAGVATDTPLPGNTGVTKGNLLILMTQCYGGEPSDTMWSLTSTTDSLGNTYTKAVSLVVSATRLPGSGPPAINGQVEIGIWYCISGASGDCTPQSVTASVPVVRYLASVLLEYTGFALGTLDGISSGGSASGTAATTGAISTAVALDLAIGFLSQLEFGFGSVPGFTPAAGVNVRTTFSSLGSFVGDVLSAARPSQAIAGDFSVGGYAAVGATFKP